MKTSVVIAVHGNWPVVERAIASLRPELGPERELVIVDDASPDGTADRLAEAVPEATLVRNEQTVGFGRSCNLGAARARGSFLCFVNSDAFVEPGALDALEATAAEGPNAAVAAILLNEDRSIQEAGWGIGRDGVTYPLGRGCRADDPQWTFRREVDYGSAACLLVRRADFEEVGGFDDRYAPGYFEDADLCMQLAERGLRTVVEPAARAIHLQYGSGDRDRAKALVRRNQELFLARWGARFAHRPIVVGARPWRHRELALRDAITLIRFLVFEDAVVARQIADRWLGSRVTLVAVHSDELSGIEVLEAGEIEQRLEERRFHYSAVLGADARLSAALEQTQPQALRLPLHPKEGLVDALAAGGIAPPGAEPRG